MRGNGRNLRREAAPVLRCVFKRRIDGGARGKAGKSAGGGALLRNRGEEKGRLEEEGRADGRARVGSERREEGEGEVGRRGAVGQKSWGWATRAERGRGKGLLGWAERRGRERGFGKELSSFFSNPFFKLSKVLNSFKTFHLLNYFPKISNQFKDS
jgi:hypothetical protein